MAYLNTDIGFYGGAYQGYNPYNYGGLSPFNYFPGLTGGQTSTLANAGINLPITASGFFGAFMPELGALTPGLRQEYTKFRGTPEAGTFEGIQKFLSGLQAHPDVQRAAYESELAGLGARLSPDEMDDEIGLMDWIKREMPKSGSKLSNLYGGMGLSWDAVSQDLTSMLAGERSSIGDLLDIQLFGKRGAGTQEAREAAFAQLVGKDMIKLSDTEVFNPFSADLMTDEYQWGGGKTALKGTDLLSMASGLMALQDLDLTRGLAGAFGRAIQTGADLGFGGRGGYGLSTRIAQLAPFLQTGQHISQDAAGLRGLMDIFYAGGADKGFGKSLDALFPGGKRPY